jgi:hypothetical protein
MGNQMLEVEFERQMVSIYEKANDACGYRPVRFLQMVHEHGGLETAKRLLSKQEAQIGLSILWENNRLDLSMEALVLNPRYQPLFNDQEITTARERLEALCYTP